MAICLSHGGRTIYSSKGPSDELLVGTVDGIVFLRRQGRAGPWKVFRRTLEKRHIVALMIEPTQRIIFAAMHNGGVAVSEDSGKTWEFRNQGLISDNVYCLNYAVAGSTVRIYAGPEPAHLFFSADMGITWSELSSLRDVPSVPKWLFPVPPKVAHVKDVAIDPRDPKILYVCVEKGGLFKSVDGGATWKELHGTLRNDDCHRLVIMPSNPNKMFLPTGFGFYGSLDGGATWENIGSRVRRLEYPDPFVVNPRNENLVFMSGAQTSPHKWLETRSADPKVVRSRDGGLTWDIVDRGMPERLDANFEAMTIEAWDGSCAVYVGNTDGDIYCTEDEGESWAKIIEGIPPISKTIHYAILRPEVSSGKDRQIVDGISTVSRYKYE